MTFPELIEVVDSKFCREVIAPTCRNFVGYRASCCFKSALNAWTASDRMHGTSVKKCLFGCEAPDAWKHYCRCKHLWHIVDIALGNRWHCCPCCCQHGRTIIIKELNYANRHVDISFDQSILLTRLGFLPYPFSWSAQSIASSNRSI